MRSNLVVLDRRLISRNPGSQDHALDTGCSTPTRAALEVLHCIADPVVFYFLEAISSMHVAKLFHSTHTNVTLIVPALIEDEKINYCTLGARIVIISRHD